MRPRTEAHKEAGTFIDERPSAYIRTGPVRHTALTSGLLRQSGRRARDEGFGLLGCRGPVVPSTRKSMGASRANQRSLGLCRAGSRGPHRRYRREQASRRNCSRPERLETEAARTSGRVTRMATARMQRRLPVSMIDRTSAQALAANSPRKKPLVILRKWRTGATPVRSRCL